MRVFGERLKQPRSRALSPAPFLCVTEEGKTGLVRALHEHTRIHVCVYLGERLKQFLPRALCHSLFLYVTNTSSVSAAVPYINAPTTPPASRHLPRRITVGPWPTLVTAFYQAPRVSMVRALFPQHPLPIFSVGFWLGGFPLVAKFSSAQSSSPSVSLFLRSHLDWTLKKIICFIRFVAEIDSIRHNTHAHTNIDR